MGHPLSRCGRWGIGPRCPTAAACVDSWHSRPTGRLERHGRRLMTTVASSLLDFILSLFRDPELAAEFNADPARVLAEHGLGDVDPADCHALIPMVSDFSAVAFGGGQGGGDEGTGGGNEDPTPVQEHDSDEGGRPQHDWNGHG